MFGIDQGAEQQRLTRQRKRLLERTEIDEDGPGTILHDFDMLLAFIRQGDGLRATRTGLLPLKALPEINARLAQPIALDLKRPQQKSYPVIHGLYLLVRASGLTVIVQRDGEPMITVDAELCGAWQALNPTERYFTLFETWLLRADAEIVGEHTRPRGGLDNLHNWAMFFRRFPDEGLAVAGNRDVAEWLRYRPQWHNLGVLWLLGLIDVQDAEPEPGGGWKIERIERTPLGNALLALCLAEIFADFGTMLEVEARAEEERGVLQPFVRPYFPSWERNLPDAGQDFRPGRHVFEVSRPGWSARLALPAEASLAVLARAILNAVEFGGDHLYEFSYRARTGVTKRAIDPRMRAEGTSAADVRIGHVPLGVGQGMTFLYDFGDSWEFDVTLEAVDPDADVDQPTVLETHGTPPEQYGVW